MRTTNSACLRVLGRIVSIKKRQETENYSNQTKILKIKIGIFYSK